MFGLGKKRSKFGKWIDQRNIKQSDIQKIAKVGQGTMTSLCNEKDYVPKYSTWAKIEKALMKLGYKVNRDDFFNT